MSFPIQRTQLSIHSIHYMIKFINKVRFSQDSRITSRRFVKIGMNICHWRLPLIVSTNTVALFACEMEQNEFQLYCMDLKFWLVMSLHLTCSLLLFDFNQNRNLLTKFTKISKCKISWKLSCFRSVICTQMDGGEGDIAILQIFAANAL